MKRNLTITLIFLNFVVLHAMIKEKKTITIQFAQGKEPFKLKITQNQYDTMLNVPGLVLQIDENTYKISNPAVDPRALKAIVSNRYLDKLSDISDPKIFDIYLNTALAIYAEDVVREINRLRKSFSTKTNKYW